MNRICTGEVICIYGRQDTVKQLTLDRDTKEETTEGERTYC